MKYLFLVVLIFLASFTIAQDIISKEDMQVKLITLVCGNAKKINKDLSDQYGEDPVWVGLGEGTSKIVLFQNSDTKSWSIVYFSKSDVACLVLSGENFKKIETY